MRDLLILILFTYGMFRAVREPYIGILVWSWIGYMNPHRLAFGFSYTFPFALIAAAVTLPALLFAREPKRTPRDPLFVLWLLFVIWMLITTLFSLYPDDAWEQLDKVLKIQLFVGLTMVFINTRQRIDALIWIIVISLGFFGIKGGYYTLTGGGEGKVWGPPGSFIEDNNQIGLAMLVCLPLMHYLRQQSVNRRVRRGLLLTMVLTVFAVLGTHSRGCLLAGLSVATFLWLKSPRKIGVGLVLIVLLPVGFLFMPESWHTRMDTIENYEEDGSAMGRINAWWMAFNLANSRLLGAGFGPWNSDAFARWAPDPNDVHAAHSIYFAVLGEHGWVGFLLFVIIAVLALYRCGATLRRCRGVPELQWLQSLMAMTQVSLIAFLVGGAFYSLAYFDLYWHLVSFAVIGWQLADRHLAAQSTADAAGRSMHMLTKKLLPGGRS